jgi:hypothetical protein
MCGCCRRCLLLLAGWCEGFCGVLVSEALAAYVVLVPFLLVGFGEVSTQYMFPIKMFICILHTKQISFSIQSLLPESVSS